MNIIYPHSHIMPWKLPSFPARSLFLVISFIITVLPRCDSRLVDPGRMFGDDNSPSQPVDPSRAGSKFPFHWNPSSDEGPWFTEDSSCSTGTGIVLKRIVRKLFNHVDYLQPNELDEEFIYQAALTYQDYVEMFKYLNNDKLNCASLHQLDTLLSNFISTAEVRRPSQANLFSNLFALGDLQSSGSSFFRAIQQWPNIYMSIIMLTVCLISYFLKNVARCGELKSYIFALVIVGFVQFLMQEHWTTVNHHQEKLEQCMNPSYFTKFLAYFNYDYNNCRKIANTNPHLFETNVAVVFGQFMSKIASGPLVPIAESIGQASQKYLGSFSLINQYTLGPFFLFFIYAGIVIIFIYIVIHFFRHKSSGPDGRRNSNARRNNNQLTGPKRMQIESSNNQNNKNKKKRN